ncbi:MAG: H+/Na+-translocating ferredoxin:NAD+ oxidoreductase subunit [Thermotogaceae bacterium]|jgi:electron transport complex protein RnfG|nr:H+/Na+-translocating ferredoxin:NAD+ oxidoreductase subunit [Thermotogaceae bacterium]MDN5337793.1 H+/Na+-translocating ferredoxin:NAD+ oxidoreductase subunit [Thermotogaceae bacterium]
MGNIIKTGLILATITLVLGFLLGLVYMVVKEPIENAELNAKLKAIKVVLSSPGKEELIIDSDELPKNLKDLEDRIWKSDEDGILFESSKYKAKVLSPAYKFTGKNGEDIYILTGSAIGYGGSVITMASFIKKDGEFYENAIEVLDYSQETPGLGARIAEKEIKKRFFGISSNAFNASDGLKVNKDAGVLPKSNEKEIEELKKSGVVQTSDVMTGATITPRAVVNTLNAMFEFLTQEVK